MADKSGYGGQVGLWRTGRAMADKSGLPDEAPPGRSRVAAMTTWGFAVSFRVPVSGFRSCRPNPFPSNHLREFPKKSLFPFDFPKICAILLLELGAGEPHGIAAAGLNY